MSLTTMTSRFSAVGAAGFEAAETLLFWDGDLGCHWDGRWDGGCDGDAFTSREVSSSAPVLALCFFFFFRFFGVEGAVPFEGPRPSGRGISSTSDILLVGLGLEGDAVAFAGEEDAG